MLLVCEKWLEHPISPIRRNSVADVSNFNLHQTVPAGARRYSQLALHWIR